MRSTSWLRPDLTDPEEADPSLSIRSSTGARALLFVPLPVRCLVFLMLSLILDFRRLSPAAVGCKRFLFVVVVKTLGSDLRHRSDAGM